MAGPQGVLICFVLLLAIAGLSALKQQNLARDFIIGGVRSILQITLLGFVLGWIFKANNGLLIFLVGCIMTFNAAVHSKGRIQVKYKALFLNNLTAIAIAIWPLAVMGSFIIDSRGWWKAEVFLPLLGMLLGNTLNGISVGIDFFGNELKSRKEEILSLIALGATIPEATDHVLKRGLRLALTPMLNSMASMGIVSIPGMMTGQLLAGKAPMDSAFIQIMIVLLIAIGTYCGTYIALIFSRKKKFTGYGIPCFE
jgi:putative ABC transport system permease protein